MDRNVKLIPLFKSDDKADLLRKLQGRIHFEKILTASNVYRNRKSEMVLPAWFVAEHGDQIRKSVLLRCPSSSKAWTVRLSICFRRYTQVKMVGGWKAFVTVNGLSKGDTLIFFLKAVSEFEVYLFRGNPKAFPSRKRFNDSKAKNAKQSHEQFAAYGNIQSNGGIAKKKRVVGEERSDSAYGLSSTSCSLTSHSSEFNLLSEPEIIGADSCRDLNNGRDHAIDHIRLNGNSESDTGDGPSQQTVKRDCTHQASALQRNSQLPGFCKKLTRSNFSTGRITGVLEIPTEFWKTYGTRQLRPFVKLQGIREESPMRTVACSRHLQENRYWRFQLREGWGGFAIENDLQVGQELQFTLAGDSFFVVRRVDS